MAHHREPYNTDFSLNGMCTPIIDAMQSVTTNPKVWLVLFLAWSVLDNAVSSHLVDLERAIQALLKAMCLEVTSLRFAS
jgi:hypothetical protein